MEIILKTTWNYVKYNINIKNLRTGIDLKKYFSYKTGIPEEFIWLCFNGKSISKQKLQNIGLIEGDTIKVIGRLK